MGNADAPSSPLAPVTEDYSARIARVEQTLQIIAEQLARFTIDSTMPPMPHVAPVIPERSAAYISFLLSEVPEIKVRNRCYSEVLAV